VTGYPEVETVDVAELTMIWPGETALLDATMLRDSLVVLSMASKIPAQRVEYSLTESALFPFQAEPTHFAVGCT
jgi:hypothetical protein